MNGHIRVPGYSVYLGVLAVLAMLGFNIDESQDF
jgi:hypothetical protein